MTNVISKEQFLLAKREQLIQMYYDGKLPARELIDWMLIMGDDRDIEWLQKNFDPNFDDDCGN
jgi:hypothetical protein